MKNKITLEDYGYVWRKALKNDDSRFSEFILKNGVMKRYKLTLESLK